MSAGKPGRPGTGGTIALLILGVVLSAVGWLVIGTAANTSTNHSLIDSDIPPLVIKALSGLLIALLGAILFGAALVRQHVAAWALWSDSRKKESAPPTS